MTYHAYFSDNLLLSQRLVTAFGMYFWLTVFFDLCFIDFLFYEAFIYP